MAETIHVKKRGCGVPKTHGLYISGGEISVEGFIPAFFELHPPVPYPTKFHRGARLVNGDKITERLPLDQWWVGSSKDTEEQKAADEYWKDTFGLPLSKRLDMGVCKGLKSPEECTLKLVEMVEWREGVFIDLFRQLTRRNLHNNPRVYPAYDRCLKTLNKVRKTRTLSNIISLVASVWEMVELVPPLQRAEFYPIFAKMMVSVGLKEDAVEIISNMRSK